MDYDQDKVDEMVLALLSLTMFKDGVVHRAWKGHDWDALDRLYQKASIWDPKSKAKSATITEEGAAGRRTLREAFWNQRTRRALGVDRASAGITDRSAEPAPPMFVSDDIMPGNLL